MRFALIITLCFVVYAQAASACSPVFKKWWENRSAKPAADCSFDGGGRHDWTHGGPAVNLGNGRVYQLIMDIHVPQSAVVTDCLSGSQIAVHNPNGEETSCGLWSSIQEHIAPDGSLDLTRGKNLSELETYVSSRGFEVQSEIQVQLNNAYLDARPRDVPDFMCGCRLYYSDSTGAKM